VALHFGAAAICAALLESRAPCAPALALPGKSSADRVGMSAENTPTYISEFALGAAGWDTACFCMLAVMPGRSRRRSPDPQ